MNLLSGGRIRAPEISDSAGMDEFDRGTDTGSLGCGLRALSVLLCGQGDASAEREAMALWADIACRHRMGSTVAPIRIQRMKNGPRFLASMQRHGAGAGWTDVTRFEASEKSPRPVDEAGGCLRASFHQVRLFTVVVLLFADLPRIESCGTSAMLNSESRCSS